MLLPAVSGGALLLPPHVVTVVYFPVRFRLLSYPYSDRPRNADEIL